MEDILLPLFVFFLSVLIFFISTYLQYIMTTFLVECWHMYVTHLNSFFILFHSPPSIICPPFCKRSINTYNDSNKGSSPFALVIFISAFKKDKCHSFQRALLCASHLRVLLPLLLSILHPQGVRCLSRDHSVLRPPVLQPTWGHASCLSIRCDCPYTAHHWPEITISLAPPPSTQFHTQRTFVSYPLQPQGQGKLPNELLCPWSKPRDDRSFPGPVLITSLTYIKRWLHQEARAASRAHPSPVPTSLQCSKGSKAQDPARRRSLMPPSTPLGRVSLTTHAVPLPPGVLCPRPYRVKDWHSKARCPL